MNIAEKYTRFLKDLLQNPNIEINEDGEFTRTELVTVSDSLKKGYIDFAIGDLLKTGMKEVFSDFDLEAFMAKFEKLNKVNGNGT